MEDNKKCNINAVCQNCYFEWVITELKQKISCPECGESEFIQIGDNDED